MERIEPMCRRKNEILEDLLKWGGPLFLFFLFLEFDSWTLALPSESVESPCEKVLGEDLGGGSALSVKGKKSLKDIVKDEMPGLLGSPDGFLGELGEIQFAQLLVQKYGLLPTKLLLNTIRGYVGEYLKNRVGFSNQGTRTPDLEWVSFYGSLDSYTRYKSKIFGEDGQLRPEFRGLEGYANFADQHEADRDGLGRMQRAFQNVSVVLSRREFLQLGWQTFHGSSSKFRTHRNKILDSSGVVKPEFQGPEGYANFADQYEKGRRGYGSMQRAFQNVSAVLSAEEFRLLGWQQFQGDSFHFRSYRDRILDAPGIIKSEFQGLGGYAHFTDQYEDGKMQKAFQNVSAVLSKEEFRLLEWQVFQGTSSEFHLYRGKILDVSGTIKPEFQGLGGYVHFANRYEKGKMQRTFKNVSAVLSEEEFRQLRWKLFQGDSSQIRSYRDWILDASGTIKPEFQGSEGYAQFSDRYEDGRMSRAFMNVSAFLSMEEFRGLGWRKFQGTTFKFRSYRSRILDGFGMIRSEFNGFEGCARFADLHEDGIIDRAFKNVSAVLSEKEFKLLGWKQFLGASSEFRSYRDWILDSSGRVRSEFQGFEGYARFADLHENGRMRRAFTNVSAVLSEAEFKLLGWKQTPGTSSGLYSSSGGSILPNSTSPPPSLSIFSLY